MTRGPKRPRLLISAKSALAVSSVAVIGLGAVWLSIRDLYVFSRCEVSVLRVHPLSFVVTAGPGVAGALLLVACSLLAFRRRLGPAMYWLAVLAAAGVLLATNYTYIGVDRGPWPIPSVRWTYPEEETGSLWSLMQVAVLGILIVVGRWLPVDHDGDVSTESRNNVFDTNAPGAA
jgi:hypothetical protein